MTPARIDRDVILGTLRGLAVGQASDADLIARMANNFRSLHATSGAQAALARDVATLAGYLRDHRDVYTASLARGALIYLNRAREGVDAWTPLVIQHQTFVAAIALHEIRAGLGEPVTFEGFRLSPEDRRVAEDLFIKLGEQPLHEDGTLIAKTAQFRNQLAPLVGVPFVARLTANMGLLAETLSNPPSPESAVWSRAGLSYVLRLDDAIDDRLGLVGLLDDCFIAQLAVGLINPAREPWQELIDAVVGAWPFLNDTVLADEGGTRTLSEFMLVNISLACPSLATAERNRRTALLLPSIGLTPFVVGFAAALGLIGEILGEELRPAAFSVGQKVQTSSGACAIFDGFQQYQGEIFFKLRQMRTRGGPSSHFYRVADLAFLYPASEDRATGGSLPPKTLAAEDAALDPIQQLFHRREAVPFHSLKRRILVVTSVTNARMLAESMRIKDRSLREILPSGQLEPGSVDTPEPAIRNWGTLFGVQKPIIIFVSDVDCAADYVESWSEELALVVLDLSGANRSRAAGVARVVDSGVPVLAITRFTEDESVKLLQDHGFLFWEWTDSDLKQLVWPADNSGPLSKYEASVQRLTSDAPVLSKLSLPEATAAHQAVRVVEKLLGAREQPLEELESLHRTGLRVLLVLLRLTVPLTHDLKRKSSIEASLAAVKRALGASRYLSDEERYSATTMMVALRQLLDVLVNSNLKGERIAEILAENPGIKVLDEDQRVPRDLIPEDGLIIPAWWDRRTMSDLLMPPVTTPLHLVLYAVEVEWYASLLRHRVRKRNDRAVRSDRSLIFPTISGWKGAPLLEVRAALGDPPIASNDIDESLRIALASRRARLVAAGRRAVDEPSVRAWMVTFEDGSTAFMSENHSINVLLLADEARRDRSEARIISTRIERLNPRDLVIFVGRSDRDAIREAANLLLPAGRRETAKLWQRALGRFKDNRGLNYREVWQELRHHGCAHHRLTVRRWIEDHEIIAPRDAHDHELRVIADTTGDPELKNRLSECDAAIRDVWGAHLRASSELAEKLLAQTTSQLVRDQRHLIQVDDVVIACVENIDWQSLDVPRSIVNRLIQDEDTDENV